MPVSPCPVVRAIESAAAGNNLNPLKDLLQNVPTTWHLTPVRDPDFDNWLPLHVAIQKNCLDALNLLLIDAPFDSFIVKFPNGETTTSLLLARRLLRIDEAAGEPDTASRRNILMRLVCAQIENSDAITVEMREIMDEISATDLHHRFSHVGDKTLLHVAVQKKRPNVVKWLLDHGASPHIQCGRGESALTLAQNLDELCANGVETCIHRYVLFSVDHPDVFISYRQGLESNIAKRMHESLTGPPFYFRVFWDRISIRPGQIWQSYFAQCACFSRVFIPLISYDGVLRTIIHNTNSNPQRPDNVLLEHILSRACHNEDEKRCVPVCIGDNAPGYPWNPFSFAPNQQNAAQLNPIRDITQLGLNTETNAQARNLLANLLPAVKEQANVAVADIWRWFSTRNSFLFSDPQLAQAAAANDPNLFQSEVVKYNQLFKAIEIAVGEVPRSPIQSPKITKGGRLTILNDAMNWLAGAALGMAALLSACSRMNMARIVTNVRRGSIIIHFRLVITPESTLTTRQGYDQLEEWYRDGSLEKELGLGPIRFELEDCFDESLLMLLHQQRCNFDAMTKKHLVGSAQLKPEYSSEELQLFRTSIQLPPRDAASKEEVLSALFSQNPDSLWSDFCDSDIEVNTDLSPTQMSSSASPLCRSKSGCAPSDVPEEGVSWEALEQFAKENNIDGLSVDDVCEQLIKPSTSSLRVAYSEFFKRKDARFVGRANIFVSHAWLCKMTDLLSALKKWLDDRQGAERAQSWFFWIDVFVCNQESSVPKEFDWWKETFRQSVERIGRTVIVMTPWKTPTYIERAWCLFEFYITLNCKIPFDLTMSEKDQVMFNAELMEGKDVVSHILKIDISQASAKFQTDKDNIMKCMEVSCQCT